MNSLELRPVRTKKYEDHIQPIEITLLKDTTKEYAEK